MKLTRMLFFSLRGIKIALGCSEWSEWKVKCFHPRDCLERGKSRIAVWEDDPLSNAQDREKSPAIPWSCLLAYFLLQDRLLQQQEFMFWLRINYPWFQFFLLIALGYRNNEVDTIEDKN